MCVACMSCMYARFVYTSAPMPVFILCQYANVMYGRHVTTHISMLKRVYNTLQTKIFRNSGMNHSGYVCFVCYVYFILVPPG